MKSTSISLRHQPRAGLSLLELLVALTLGSVLLSAVWAMFSIFSRRLESDTFKAEETQLVRGFHQILSRDLGNVLPQSVASIETGILFGPGSSQPAAQLSGLAFEMQTRNSSGPGVSFVGTPDRLELQLFDDDPELIRMIEPNRRNDRSDVPGPLRHQSSRVVVYSWQRSGKSRIENYDSLASSMPSAQESSEPVNSGLSRKELYAQFETSNDSVGPGFRSGAISPTRRLPKTGSNSLSNRQEPERENSVVSDETIPEITRLDFGYYDGHTWRTNWNSRESGNLPIAVRVRFDIDMKHASEKPEAGEQDGEEPAFRDTSKNSGQLPDEEVFGKREFILIVSPPAPSQPKKNPALQPIEERRKPKS